MDEFNKALEEFGQAVGKLKNAYVNEFGGNPNYLSIHVNADNEVTILPENCTGNSLEFFREYIYTE